MVELFVLTSSRFPLRKPEEKFTSAESRTHEFRLSGRMLYPLVHGGILQSNLYRDMRRLMESVICVIYWRSVEGHGSCSQTLEFFESHFGGINGQNSIPFLSSECSRQPFEFLLRWAHSPSPVLTQEAASKSTSNSSSTITGRR